jgi:signal transduction histidine kinase
MPETTLDRERLERLIALGRSLLSELDVGVVLDRVLETARQITGARFAALGILDEDRRELSQFVSQGVDDAAEQAIGHAPRGLGTLGLLMSDPRPVRIADVGGHPRFCGFPRGHPRMHSFLGVPIVIRGEAWGNLYLADKAGGEFDEADEDALVVLADWAAIAIENARTVEADRLRRSIEAAEAERRRWARELHDETLQGLGGLKVQLWSATAVDDPEAKAGVLRQAIDDLSRVIENLRAIITELRPAALDQLGLRPALRSLAQRTASVQGLVVTADLALGDGERRLPPELETTVYRLVQEALTNVVKHARAGRVEIVVRDEARVLEVTVADDGAGFDPSRATTGYGLLGMRERVELAGGELRVEPGPAGTVVRARLPLPAAQRSSSRPLSSA